MLIKWKDPDYVRSIFVLKKKKGNTEDLLNLCVSYFLILIFLSAPAQPWV